MGDIPDGSTLPSPSPGPPLAPDCQSVEQCNGYCLYILNVTITEDTYIHAMNLIVAIVLALSLIIVTFKLNRGYNNVFNLDTSDAYLQQTLPLSGLGGFPKPTAGGNGPDKRFKFFLPYYSAYIQVVTFWFLAEVIVLILPPSQTMLVISSILFAGHGFLDNSIIVIFFFKKLNRRAIGWSFFLGLLVVGVKFAMLIASPRTLTCGWCALFSPQTSALIPNIVLLMSYVFSLVAAAGLAPPQFRARPQLRTWSMFLIVVYIMAVTGITLVKFQIDAGYCVLAIGVLIYNSLYAYLLYFALSRDSADYVDEMRQDAKASSINTVGHDTRDRMVEDSIDIIDFDKIHLVRVIGSGGFAEVYLGTWNSTAVAVKRLYNKGLGDERREQFLQEVSLMSTLRHPNIVLFLGVSFTNVDDNPLILTEYMERGALFELLHEAGEQGGVPYRLVLSIAIDIAKGMSYLHDRKPAIIHRDLKSHNVLIDGNWVAKVADFGLSRPEQQRTMTRIGTPQWSAPEVLRGERYGPAADVYSYGVILYELMERKVPHDGIDPIKTAYDVAFGNVSLTPGQSCPPLMRDLMKSCLSHTPGDRPSFDECLVQLELICQDFHPSLLE